MGGGGGTQCGMTSCISGCCLGGNCVPVNQQGNGACGFFGDACRACGTNEGCVSGRCQPVIGLDAGLSAVGGPCTQDPDCGNDGLAFCIPEVSGGQPTGFPGGYCSRMCDTASCPPDSRCVEAQTQGGGTVNVCLASCMSQANCRHSYQCDSMSGGICLP